jgi:ankyrin repeat protein
VRDLSGALPLHLAARARADPAVLAALLAADPAAALQPDAEGRLPLHHSLCAHFPANAEGGADAPPPRALAVGDLVRPSPFAPPLLTLGTPREPLLHLCGGALGEVRRVLSRCARRYFVTRRYAPPEDGSGSFYLPKELLLATDAVPVCAAGVAALLAAAPAAAGAPDGQGRTPLFLLAASAAPPSRAVFEALLAAQPDSPGVPDDTGAYPLHAAAWAGAPQWLVEALLAACPAAAAAQETRSRRTPLHFALEARAPEACVLALLRASPGTTGFFTLSRQLPLHAACGAPPALVAPLLAAFPGAARERTVAGNLPLHLLVASPRADIGAVGLVLDAFPQGAREKSRAGRLPLLCAAAANAPLPVLQALHAAHPEGLREADDGGNFPAHLAVQRTQGPVAADVVAWLKNTWAGHFKERNADGRLPLHCAASRCCSSAELLTVLAAHPAAAAVADSKGNLPLHLVLSTASAATPEVVRALLRGGGAALANEKGNLPLHCIGEDAPPRGAEACALLLEEYPEGARVLNVDGRTPLHNACAAGADAAIIGALLRMWPEAARLEADNAQLPLHFAAAGGAPREALELLLEAHPDGVRARTKIEGQLPLHLACAGFGNRHVPNGIALLLERYHEGARVPTKKTHRFPLHYAAAAAHPRVVELVLRAYPEAAREKDSELLQLPLHTAVFNAAAVPLSTIALLLAAHREGAAARDNEDQTPLHLVRAGTSVAAAELLIAANPDALVSATAPKGLLPLHCAVNMCASKGVVALLLSAESAKKPSKNSKMLPLHYAVTENQLEVVKLLVDAFPDALLSPTTENFFPLHSACGARPKGGLAADVIRFLLERAPGAAAEQQRWHWHEYPIFLALVASYVPMDIVEALHAAATSATCSKIKNGFNLGMFTAWGQVPVETLRRVWQLHPGAFAECDEDGRLPLHCGAASREAMEFLLEVSPRDGPRRYDILGHTPAMHAIQWFDTPLEAFQLLLARDKGAVGVANTKGLTALHLACGENRSDPKRLRSLALINALLAAFPAAARMRVVETGYLPLHVACCYKASAEVVTALLKNEGRDAAKEAAKDTSLPLHLALEKSAPHAATLLVLRAHPGAVRMPNKEGKLPLHLALERAAPEALVAEIFALHPEAARVRDSADNEPLLLLQKSIVGGGSCGGYSAALLGALLLECLPPEAAGGGGGGSGATGAASAPPCAVWHVVLADCKDKLVAGVEEVLRRAPGRAEALAFALDEHGRRALDRATPLCKAALISQLFLCGRFELQAGPAEHASATSVVRFARDWGATAAGAAAPPALGGAGSLRSPPPPGSPISAAPAAAPTAAPAAASAASGAPPTVCLKFLRSKDNFQRELAARADPLHGPTSPECVMPILASFDGSRDIAFAEALEARGLASHPFLLVFPAGERPLSAVIDHERETPEWAEETRLAACALAAALAHLHCRGVVHGDLKPRNVVRMGRRYLLIDLDASCRFGEPLGVKTSTALAPPELLSMLPSGRVALRAPPYADGARPLPAAPSFDVWQLGATLYHMLTGASLLHASASDNAVDEAQLLLAAQWEEEVKAAKLAAVASPRARDLLALLLDADPLRRPTAARVLEHPFLTNSHCTRLRSEPPAWDVFLSYRVASDAALAQALYDALTAARLPCGRALRVWWDKECLTLGKDWRVGFCGGLASCRAFLPLLSRAGFAARDAAGAPLAGRNWGALRADSPCDNVLLEHRLALELARPERGLIEFVVPLFVGDEVPGAPGEHGGWGRDVAPCSGGEDASVEAVDSALRKEMDACGLGSPYAPRMGPQEVWRLGVDSKQGHFLRGKREEAVATFVAHVAATLAADGGGRGARAAPAAAAALAYPSAAPAPPPSADAVAVAELERALEAVRAEAAALRAHAALGIAAQGSAAGERERGAVAAEELDALRGELEAVRARAREAGARANAVEAELDAARRAPAPPPGDGAAVARLETEATALRAALAAAAAEASSARCAAAAAESEAATARAAVAAAESEAAALRRAATEAAAAAAEARTAVAEAELPASRQQPPQLLRSSGAGARSGGGAPAALHASELQAALGGSGEGGCASGSQVAVLSQQVLLQGQALMGLQREVLELRQAQMGQALQQLGQQLRGSGPTPF